uniref:NADH-ubiquinone oxidoreductase chain 2 n=1 Tax=Cucujoidea sp. 23 KM-2017 TaxID=2219360 RepID=A0A346RI24_9CUCU|nr:NADH dehydrogenase subunit 2 [Cucujoidea sp. 23 KM-2017]
MMFFNFLILSTLITISSYSWLSMWLGLEINLMSIIPLMQSNKNIYPTESSMKYFFTQSLSSIIVLFSIIMSMYNFSFIFFNQNLWILMILNSALFTKMGAAPFHFWFPQVMEGLNWNMCLIMLTWQKIAPMIMMMYNFKMINFIIMVVISCSIISGVTGLNQISLRKLMTYSSINHIGWMISSTLFSMNVWLMYFIIYSLISINIIFILKIYNIFFMKQFIIMLNNQPLIKMIFIMNFMSLAGLPPFLGFLPKWITLNMLIYNNFYFMTVILTIFTLLSLFFYLRIMLSSMMFNHLNIKIYHSMKMKYLFMLYNMILLFSLLFYNILFFN